MNNILLIYVYTILLHHTLYEPKMASLEVSHTSSFMVFFGKWKRSLRILLPVTYFYYGVA